MLKKCLIADKSSLLYLLNRYYSLAVKTYILLCIVSNLANKNGGNGIIQSLLKQIMAKRT